MGELTNSRQALVTPWSYRCDATNSTVGGNYPGHRFASIFLYNKEKKTKTKQQEDS